MSTTASDPLATAAARSWVDETAEPARVLDADRRDDLVAWVDGLVPGDDVWPPASAVGAVEYVEAVAARVPAFGPLLVALLVAAGGSGRFAALEPGVRTSRMRAIEWGGDATTFRRVYELVCEQYYRAPEVVRIVHELTGFDTVRPTVGTAMTPFDTTRLDRVRSLPLRFPERA